MIQWELHGWHMSCCMSRSVGEMKGEEPRSRGHLFGRGRGRRERGQRHAEEES